MSCGCDKDSRLVVSNGCCSQTVVENCGCKNKTEFSCITYTGQDLEVTDITRGMSGDRVLEAICETLSKLKHEVDMLDLSLLDIDSSVLEATKVVAGDGIKVDYDNDSTYKVSLGVDIQGYIDEKINKLKEDLMAFLIFNLREADTFGRCIQITDGNSRAQKTIRVAQPVNESVLLDVKLRNTCSMSFTLPRTVIYNANGVVVTVRELTIPSGQQLSPTVDITGVWNGQVGNVEVNGNVENVPLLVNLNVLAQEVFENCVRVHSSTNSAVTITSLRNRPNDFSIYGVTFENTCSIPFTTTETVVINENGLRVVLPAVRVPAMGTARVEYKVTGTYTGTKQTINVPNVTVNGLNVGSLTVNITNTAPVANDVTINLANRENRFFSAADLIWTDAEQDTLQAVRFTGNVSRIFVVPTSDSNGVAAKAAVTANTEYGPATKFYFEAPDQNDAHTYQVTYNVKAGGQWSN